MVWNLRRHYCASGVDKGEVVRAYLVVVDKCSSFGKAMASLFMHRVGRNERGYTILGIVLINIDGNIANPFLTYSFCGCRITVSILPVDGAGLQERWMFKKSRLVYKTSSKNHSGRWNLEKYREAPSKSGQPLHDSIIEYRHDSNLSLILLYLGVTGSFSLVIPTLFFYSLVQPIHWGHKILNCPR